MTAVSMSLMPLSPINEGWEGSPEQGSSSSSGTRRRSRHSSLLATAASPSAAVSPATAPRIQPASAGPAAPTVPEVPAPMPAPATPSVADRDLSADSSGGLFGSHGGAVPSPSPAACALQPTGSSSKAGKVVLVNGVAYTQMELLGRGGSSKVYSVLGPSGERLALKRVTSDNVKQLEAFQNEAILLRSLRHREQVIQVVDSEVDEARGRISIVMEAGEADLSTFLRSEPQLPLVEVQRLWRQMLECVQVIHAERIVHADLKPANFLLVGRRLKVIDFGIAKRLASDTTNISRDSSVGTLSYMAPEAVKQGQEGGLKLGRASDIWSLGIILYQMVYGRPPLAHMEPMQRWLKLSDPHLEIEYPERHSLEDRSSRTKAYLIDVLRMCLQRDPRKRPTLQELLGHPFLCGTQVVQRETLEGAIGRLMTSVLKAVDPDGTFDCTAKWQALSDEVWEELLVGVNGTSGGDDFQEGLASLRAAASRQASSTSSNMGRPRRPPTPAEEEEPLSPLGCYEDADEYDAVLAAGMLPPPGSTAPLAALLPPPGSTAPMPRPPLSEVPRADAQARPGGSGKKSERGPGPRKPTQASANTPSVGTASGQARRADGSAGRLADSTAGTSRRAAGPAATASHRIPTAAAPAEDDKENAAPSPTSAAAAVVCKSLGSRGGSSDVPARSPAESGAGSSAPTHASLGNRGGVASSQAGVGSGGGGAVSAFAAAVAARPRTTRGR